MEHLPVLQPPREDTSLAAFERSAVRPSGSPYGGYVEIDSGDGGDDELGKWLKYWHVLTRHKLALLLTTLGGVLVAFVVSLFQTPLYVTRTTLEINQASERQPFEGVSFMNDRDPYLLQTQAQILRSGPLQARVFAKLSDRAPEPIATNDPLASTRKWLGLASSTESAGWNEALQQARGGLTITPVRDTRIVQIMSASTLPQAAADYVNTLAQEFINQNLEERWSLYQSTGAWLERAQQELKTKLEESERQLLAYASASGLIVTSNQENIAEQKLLEMQTEVSRAQAERIAKEAVYRTVMSSSSESLTGILDRGPMATYEIQIADLRRELAEATTSLTAAHPKVKRLQAQIDELTGAQSREQTNVLNRLRTDYESALHRERQLLSDFGQQTKVLAGQDQKLIRYKMLQREVETYQKIYETTLQTGKEASIVSALRPVNAKLIDPARPARVPSTPNLNRNLIAGLAAGLVLGVGLILIRERTDVSIRAPGSIPLTTNLRELGVIPSAKADPTLSVASGRRLFSLPAAAAVEGVDGSGFGAEAVELATWSQKSSLLAESFRATLTSILMSGQNGHDKRIILVTSPSPREGKSTVITNLAIALSEIYPRVLLIDADLRRPRLHTIFRQANTWGLSDLLREETPCADYPVEALARKTHIPGVFCLPSGPASATVSRLLYSTRMADLLNRLRTEFDAVLIDTPPVLSVADPRILSRLVDAVVLVFRAGQTKREAATMAVNIFEADGIPVLGTVLNDWDSHTMGNGYYPSEYQQYYQDASNG